MDSPTALLKDKTVIVTGANSGIGKETALALAGMGAQVVMVCRNKEKGESARKEIVSKGGSADLILCDLSSFESVRALAGEVKRRYTRLDVLVNNAGLFSFSGKTADGFENTLEVDYLAPFLLTNLLVGLLESSAPSRVVNVSSIGHYNGHVDLEAIAKGGGASGWGAYGNAKLALVMFTYEFARRLEGTGVTANCLHPGAVATGIWRMPSVMTRPFMRSARRGAETSIYLASSPEVQGVTGKYFDDKKEKRSSEESYDVEKQARLWDLTAKLVGL